MWFKNFRFYQFTKPFEENADSLTEKLSEYPFHPCKRTDFRTQGWLPPLGQKSTQLVHSSNRHLLISLSTQEKMIPNSYLRELLTERVQELEDRQGHKLGKREKANLKDEIFHDLLPQAFTKTAQTFAWIAPQQQWLIIDAASEKKAAEMIDFLRKSCDSLPVRPLDTHMSPDTVMTQWLQDHSPSDITADDSCELFDPDESGNVIRCKHQDLNSDEISQHLRVGKRVSQLGIIWQDRLSMILQSDLSIKRLRLMDVLQQQREDTHAETALEQLDADFVLMTLEMEKFLPQLFEHCGGENKD